MAKRDGKVWQRAQANKKRIYFSAMRLFAEHGYDNVSVDDIVREANSSKGTFYNYFRSKDELFVFYNQALDERFIDFHQKLLHNKHYTGKDGLEKVYIMSMYILHALAANGREFTAVPHMRQLRGEDGGAPEEDVLCNAMHDVFPSLFEIGQRDGSIRADLDIKRANALLYQLLCGIVFEWECGGGDMIGDDAFVIDFFCRSIAAPAQPA